MHGSIFLPTLPGLPRTPLFFATYRRIANDDKQPFFLGSIGSAFCLGQMVLGPYAGFKDIGVTAILGFVVWYTFTKMNGTLEKILEKLDNLNERLPKN